MWSLLLPFLAGAAVKGAATNSATTPPQPRHAWMDEMPPERCSALAAAIATAVAPRPCFWSTNHMRWNRKPSAERPEYPKLVALAGTAEQARDLLPVLRGSDPEPELVDGGARGVYARVHNEAAEAAARAFGESRSFPLA